MGFIVGFEKLSLLDYDDKLSAVIFFWGCNFRCPYCHNADIVAKSHEDKAIIPTEDIIAYLEKRKGVLDAVVITGGEPTLYINEELISLMKKIKELGYLIKLDTNGSFPNRLKELLDLGSIDFVAMDIKNSLRSYSKTIGGILDGEEFLNNIKTSIEMIMSSGVDYEFRTTIVKGFHTKEDMKEIGELIKGAKKYRLQKFVDQGTCMVDNLEAIPIEEAEEFVKILKPYIPNTGLRGYN